MMRAPITKTYKGRPPGSVVVVEGETTRALPPRHDLRNHSPDGFAWGYAGSGPAQLALAIVADCCGDTIAQRVYQEFKRRIVARLPMHEPWTVGDAVVNAAVADIMRKQA